MADKVVTDCTTGDTATLPLTKDELAQHQADTEQAADLAWQSLRTERDALLAATDWTQLPDTNITDPEAWTAYRQALRDLPNTTADPANPDWPTGP